MKKFLIVLSVLVGIVTVAIEVGAVAGVVYAVANHVVVVDPGHGGRDNGVSYGELSEADLTLKIANTLKDELETRGIVVALTREDELGLYDNNVRNKKRSDMKRRHDIIERAQPDLVISIHVNSFPRDKSVRGIQTFYHGESGKIFAEKIQGHLNSTNLTDKKRTAMKGDFFILETAYPSVLIECGFISNPGDYESLSSMEYLKTLSSNIADAIILSLQHKEVNRQIPWWSI